MARWFNDKASGKLGAIVSLPYAAVGAGMLVLPPATQLLLDRMPWQDAHRMLGIVVLAMLPVLFALPLKRVSAGSPAWQAARRAALAAGKPTWALSEAMRTPAFWGLFTAYVATSVAAYSVLPQSVAYLVAQGFSPLFAAGAFGMTGALSTVGIIGIAALSDVLGRRQMATLSYLSSIAGITFLILTSLYPSPLMVYGFVLFFGVMQGVRGPIILATVATLYRGGAVGSIFGTLMLGAGLGAALGSFASGVLHDATGGYTASLLLAIGGCCVGMASFWVVPSIRNMQIETSPAAAKVNSAAAG
jgi:MFS family permease